MAANTRRPLGAVSVLLIAGPWIALALAAGLLYFRVQLQSDSLFLDDLARNLFDQGGSWRAWRLTPAPAFLPDMLLYFIFWHILPGATLRIFAVSVMQVLLLAAASAFVARQLTSGRARQVAQSLAVLVVAALALVSTHSEIWLFFYSTNNHFAALLFPLVIVGAALKYLRRPRWTTAALILLCGVAGQLSTSVYIIDFAAPGILGCAVWWLVARREVLPYSRRRVVYLGALIAGSSVVAAGIGYLIGVGSGFGRIGFSLEMIARGARSFGAVVKYVFTGGGPAMLALTLAVLGMLVYILLEARRRLRGAGPPESSLAWLRSDQDAPAIGFALVIGIIALPVSILGSIFSGALVDVHGYRYFVFPLALLVIVGCVFLASSAEGTSWSYRIVAIPLVVALFACAGSYPVFVTAPVDNYVYMGRQPASTYAQAAQCIDDLQQGGVQLTAGIADFWFARAVSLQADGTPPIVAVLDNLDPYYWMSTIEPLERVDKYPRVYDFALVPPHDTMVPFSINAEKMAEVLPVPDRIYPCSPDVDVWIWKGSAMDKVVKAHFAAWLSSQH